MPASKIKRHVCVSVFLIVNMIPHYFFVEKIGAQSPSATPESTLSPKLPGSSRKLDTVAPLSDLIFIGRIKSFGTLGNPTAPGVDDYEGVQIDVQTVLKGAISESSIKLVAHLANLQIVESLPREKTPFLFFAKSEGMNLHLLKILPAEEHTIVDVKKAIEN